MPDEDWRAYIEKWRRLREASAQMASGQASSTLFSDVWDRLSQQIAKAQKELQSQLSARLDDLRHLMAEDDGRPDRAWSRLEELRFAAGEGLGDPGKRELASLYTEAGTQLWDADAAGARLAFERALALEPGQEGAIIEVFEKRGGELLKEGNLEAGLAVFDAALTLIPQHQELCNSLAKRVLEHGEGLAKQDDWLRAARCFRWVRDLRLATPAFPVALDRLAEAERRLVGAGARVLGWNRWTAGLVACALLAGIGLSYVWGKSQIVSRTSDWISQRQNPTSAPSETPTGTPAMTLTATPSPDVSVSLVAPSATLFPEASTQAPSPTPSLSEPAPATPTQTPSPTLTATGEPSWTPSPTASPTVTPSETPLASVTPASTPQVKTVNEFKGYTVAYLRLQASTDDKNNAFAFVQKGTKATVSTPPDGGASLQNGFWYVSVEAFVELSQLKLNPQPKPGDNLSIKLQPLKLKTITNTEITLEIANFGQQEAVLPIFEGIVSQDGSLVTIRLSGWIAKIRLD